MPRTNALLFLLICGLASTLAAVAIDTTCLPVRADARYKTDEISATIVAYGRYKIEEVSAVPTKDKTSGGVTLTGKNVKHIETTNIIPCKVGETWGITVKFHSLPKGRPFKIREEVDHPPIKQPNGEILSRSVTESYLEEGTDPSGDSLWSFLDGYEYELVPGKWTMKICIDGVEVVAKSFEIKKVD